MEARANALVVEREELVISSSSYDGRQPTLRTCHFLKPCLPSSHEGPLPDPPPLSPAFPPLFDPAGSKRQSNIKFEYPSVPSKSWVKWVELMEPLHRLTWQKSGILEALRCSTYRIVRDYELILGLAEKWCPCTNTFVFSWGEASITLEDVYLLGGYSVLGSPVTISVEDGFMSKTHRRLKEARSRILKTTAKKASLGQWMNAFKGSGSDIEHEAFLAFWLSKFMFPRSSPKGVIYEDVFPMAIHLARGNKIAIAPAVLASIYRDLSSLKKAICDLAAEMSNSDDHETEYSDIMLWAPFGLVQVWAWERFVFLRPQPDIIRPGKPRLSRWDNVRSSEPKKLRAILDTNDGTCFEWRPYAKEVQNFEYPRFYHNRGRQTILEQDDKGEEEILLFARCLVPCELVGHDSVKQYLPHRVAMQFGMDQDIPDRVTPCNQSPKVAWKSYDCSFHGASVFLPPRGYKPCLTKRYQDWWSSRALEGPAKGLKETKKGDENNVEDDDHLMLSEFRSKIARHNVRRSSRAVERPVQMQKSMGLAEGDKNSVPHGSKSNQTAKNVRLAESTNKDDDDHLTLIQLRNQRHIAGDCIGNPSKTNPESFRSLVSPAKNVAVRLEDTLEDHDPERIRRNILTDPTSEGVTRASSMERTGEEEISVSVSGSRSALDIDMLELGLAARVSDLERDVAALKLSKATAGRSRSQKQNSR